MAQRATWPPQWKWRRYDGLRIVTAGWRTFIDVDIAGDKAYGYVWPLRNTGGFRASWEYLSPGEVIDKDLGEFVSRDAAKEAVVAALVREYR